MIVSRVRRAAILLMPCWPRKSAANAAVAVSAAAVSAVAAVADLDERDLVAYYFVHAHINPMQGMSNMRGAVYAAPLRLVST